MIAKIKFTRGAIPFVLKAFNKEIDGAGFISDITTGEIVEDRFGDQLTEDNFGGISKSGFFKLGLFSIMDLVDNKGA